MNKHINNRQGDCFDLTLDSNKMSQGMCGVTHEKEALTIDTQFI